MYAKTSKTKNTVGHFVADKKIKHNERGSFLCIKFSHSHK